MGAGVAAQAIHVAVLCRRSDLFSVTGICDLSAAARDAVGDRCKVPSERRFANVEDLLDAGGVDALLVLTSGSHGATCLTATTAGLPVFCEKPLAYTVAEADALARASSVLALGYMKVYDAAVRRAAELLADRSPRSVEVVILHPPAASQLAHLRLVPPDDVPANEHERLEREEQRLLEHALGAAPAEARNLYRWRILGSIVHDLSVVRVLAGNPVGWDRVDAWPAKELSSVALEGQLENEGRLSIRWHYLENYPVYREELRVHDERGSVQVTFPSPYGPNPAATLTVVDHTRGRARTSEVTFPTSPFEEELEAFHRLVTDGQPTAAGIEEGRSDIVSCQRALRIFCETNGLPVGAEALAA
jgi:predicted dehydrogenase